jgi:hypothetical protein
MPELAVSAPFILSERYIRVDAPDDSGFAGFWCEVRQNLSNGDRRLLVEALDEISDSAAEQIEASRVEAERIAESLNAGLPPTEQRAALKRLGELTAQMEELGELARTQRWALAAPHIRDWNAHTSEGDETPAKVTPPAKGGVLSLDEITRDMADWIVNQVLMAYRSGKGVLNRSTPPGDSGRPTGGPKAASGKGRNTSTTPTRPKNSSGHSASAFQA